MKLIVRNAVLAALLIAASGCGAKKNSADATPVATDRGAASPSTGAMPAVSAYDSGPRAASGSVDEAAAKQGSELFRSKGCSACHAFGKRLTCPDLAGVSQRRTAAWIEQQILHPDVMTKKDPIAHELFAKFALQMPNQALTPEQARAVIEFFKHQDHEAGESVNKGDSK